MKNGIRYVPKIKATIKLIIVIDFVNLVFFNINNPKSRQTAVPPIQLNSANKPCRFFINIFAPTKLPVNIATTETKIPQPIVSFLKFSFTFSSFKALPIYIMKGIAIILEIINPILKYIPPG